MLRLLTMCSVYLVAAPLWAAEPLLSIPVEQKERDHVVGEGVINGRWELPMVVDTGAMVALLPTSALQELNLDGDDVFPVQATTASDVSTMRGISLESISVQGDRIDNVTALLRDLNMRDAFASTPGVLPARFLERYTVHFDLANQKLELHAPGTDVARILSPAGYSRVPFERAMGFVVFELTINGVPIPTVLDTGAGGAPVINWAAAESLGVTADHPDLRPGNDIHGAGENGLPSMTFAFDTIALGDAPIPVSRVGIADMPHFKQLIRPGPAANIGLRQLRGRSLVIDYAAGVLYLQMPGTLVVESG